MPGAPAPPLPPQNRAPGSHPATPSHLSCWTKENEERLVYVQGQLTAAQAAWSEEQDLWIDEVHHLEDLKRKCLKAEKKAIARGRANSVASIWKAKTWGGKSKNSSAEASGENSPRLFDEPENTEDAVEEEDGDGEESTSRTKSVTSLFRTISLTGKKDGDAGNSRHNTFDGGQPPRPTLPATPEHSFSSADGVLRGKGNVLKKRRGSGR
ncbi:MAG: hypothetical protein Q9166_001586 [cf. Caloplaca sp. 2 TL-2023]